jgi:hypothetical protein
MRTFVALDVSLEKTAICIMSTDGRLVAELTAASDPEAIAAARRPWDQTRRS